MGKLKKLLDKKKTIKPIATVVKMDDEQTQKQDENNEFQTEVKGDDIDMINNL